MESEREGKVVCVTGASGFLASWLVKRLLLCVYQVVGTVRDPGNEEKVGHLWRLEGAKERLRLVKAELMEEGSFHDAINGCHGMFHTASPVFNKPCSDPLAEIFEPAVKGTLNVLRSCKRNIGCLRRVVFTSSSSAVRVREEIDPDVPLDESSWTSEQLCYTLKVWYALSKTLAEQATWELIPWYTLKLKSLGFIKFKPPEEMFDDCISSLLEQGHLSLPREPNRTTTDI